MQILAAAVAVALEDCSLGSIKWNYETGLLLYALSVVSERFFCGLFGASVRERLDELILNDGTIRGYSIDEYNLDQINAGKVVFRVWKATGADAYLKAIRMLAEQLDNQPRTPSGSYWHKKIYPNQVWLDGLYMFGPFQARYAVECNRPELIDDLCSQFLAVRGTMRHEGTGLYYHAKDESGVSLWAYPKTGCSPHVWARAAGWLSMALVDSLDWIPGAHVQRSELEAMLADLLDAIIRAQQASGLWLQVMDCPSEPGNYEETSASAIFVYSLFKSARKGYWRNQAQAATWKRAAHAALRGIVARKVSWECHEGRIPRLHLGGICEVAGLGGTPYRDGSFEYYIREPIVADDFKGMGPFILALGEELELLHG